MHAEFMQLTIDSIRTADNLRCCKDDIGVSGRI